MATYIKRGTKIYDQERWELLQQMVEDRCSFNEIRRTIGIDYRQVKAWFPEYDPIKQGSEEHRELTRIGRKMRELERREW